MTKFLRLSFVLLCAMLLMQCTGSKTTMGSSKTKPGLYKEFFVGAEGTQYFINPLSFEGENGQSEMTMDITFRYKDEIKDSATVNFTIITDEMHKNLNSISIENSKVKAITNELTLLFNEVEKKAYASRFSCKLTVAEINQLFMDGEWDVLLNTGSSDLKYQSAKAAKKSIEGIEKQVFVLMR